jgi:hypothetical protein
LTVKRQKAASYQTHDFIIKKRKQRNRNIVLTLFLKVRCGIILLTMATRVPFKNVSKKGSYDN